MVRIADIKQNDCVNGEGICVSVWMQGCPFHCKGCHNPETWDFNGGRIIEDEKKLIADIIKDIKANGVQRNLSILGGEPLVLQNRYFIYQLIETVKSTYPDIKIFLWTGFEKEEIENELKFSPLKLVDTIIVGRYVQEQRDITLKLRGSRNQRILYKGKDY